MDDDELRRYLEKEAQRGRPSGDDIWDTIDTGPFGPRYFDRAGQPISLRQWSELRRSDAGVRVALTPITDTSELSTVWLGLDHNHMPWLGGPPIIFESMYFVWDPQIFNVLGLTYVSERQGHLLARYSTLEQALAGHDQLIEHCKDGTWEEL